MRRWMAARGMQEAYGLRLPTSKPEREALRSSVVLKGLKGEVLGVLRRVFGWLALAAGRPALPIAAARAYNLRLRCALSAPGSLPG